MLLAFSDGRGARTKAVRERGYDISLGERDPQVAAVGLTEEQAREHGLHVRVVTTPTGGVAGAYVQGNGIDGTCQIVVDEDRRTIVGATFYNPATLTFPGEYVGDYYFADLSGSWINRIDPVTQASGRGL